MHVPSWLPPWHPHPDVWLLIALFGGSYAWAVKRLGPRVVPEGEEVVSRRQVTWFTAGVLVLWLASDWPVHDLAERYLFSVHMFQHMLISLIAPPMLLLGMPTWLLRRLVSPRPVNWVVRNFTRPFIALVMFNLWIVLSHWPAVMEALLYHHWLHFFAHALLFITATFMWWPVVAPLPEMPALSYPGRMLYLFLQSIVPTVPASFLTFGTSPLYHFYTTVPRIWGISVMTDQLISGLLMKLGGGAILWTVLAVVFFKWYAEEHATGWDALQWRDVEANVRTEMAKRADRAEEMSQR